MHEEIIKGGVSLFCSKETLPFMRLAIEQSDK